MRDLSVALTNDEDIWLHDNNDYAWVHTNAAISIAEFCKYHHPPLLNWSSCCLAWLGSPIAEQVKLFSVSCEAGQWQREEEKAERDRTSSPFPLHKFCQHTGTFKLLFCSCHSPSPLPCPVFSRLLITGEHGFWCKTLTLVLVDSHLQCWTVFTEEDGGFLDIFFSSLPAVDSRQHHPRL